MSTIPTSEFLSHLKSLYPTPAAGDIRVNPWSYITAVAFSASNVPEAVPVIFEHALKEVDTYDQRLALARQFRDAIFKSGILSGYPKTISALIALHEVMPEDLRDRTPLRDVTASVTSLQHAGQAFYEDTYGSTSESVQNLLKDIYPDLEYFCITLAYGYTISFCAVLTPMETSLVMIAALIASDAPLETEWHLRGAIRNGASVQEVRSVRQLVIEAAKSAGVVWKGAIPDLIVS